MFVHIWIYDLYIFTKSQLSFYSTFALFIDYRKIRDKEIYIFSPAKEEKEKE